MTDLITKTNQKEKQIYLAGDMLSDGAQWLRSQEKEKLLSLGYEIYVPQDQEFNDKEANKDAKDLPQRIVRNDTQGIIESDIVVMEATNTALGTAIELGQIKGMKDMAQLVKNCMHNPAALEDLCNKMLNKKVYCHNSDIRIVGGTDGNYFMNYGHHAYLEGVVDDVAETKNWMKFTEILAILK